MSLPVLPAGAGLDIAFLLAPASFGGLESVVELLGCGLLERGHRLTVAVLGNSATPPPVAERLAAAGAEMHCLPVPRRRYDTEIRVVRNLLRDRRPQLLHSHGAHPDVIARFAADRLVPRLSTVHGFTGGSWRNRLYEGLQILALRRFEGVIPVSLPLAERLERSGVPAARIRRIPNAIRPGPLVDRAEARRRLGAPAAGALIGWVGRVSHEKGPDLFVEAVDRLAPTDRAVVVGEGPLRAALMARAASGSPGQILWTGAVSGAAGLLRAFDLLVLSSRTEGTPMILLEAMAAGVPVVAARVGGVPDVIGPEEGLLVAPGDVGALAAAIQSVLAGPDAARRRAEKAFIRVAAEYAPGPWIDRYEQAYRAILPPMPVLRP